jgi:hypothetical protein
MSELNAKVYKACGENDVEFMSQYLNSTQYKESSISPYNLILLACKNHSVEILSSIFNSPYKRDKLENWDDVNSFIKMGVASGNLEIVHFLLKNPMVLETNSHAVELAATHASINGNLQILESLIDSYPQDEHLSHSLKNGSIFIDSISSGHLKLVDFLINSPKVKTDIHLNEDQPFKCAYNSSQLAILEYFIVDLNIEKTDNIIEHLNANSDTKINKLFELRELHKSLDEELPQKIYVNKKAKI